VTKKKSTTRAHAEHATAIHEAGHAVLSLVLDVPVVSVTVVPSKTYSGATRHGADWERVVAAALSDDGPQDVEPQDPIAIATTLVITSLAGRIAEEVIVGSVGDACKYDDDESGITTVVGRVCMTVGEGDALVEWLTVRTRNLVTAHRAKIERVAAALLEHGTLDEVAIRRAAWPPHKLSKHLWDAVARINKANPPGRAHKR
jgi:hypothetical protein